MDYQEALRIINEAVTDKTGRPLNNVEMTIFKGSWEGLTYNAIAEKSDYEVNYLKGDAGHKFWSLVSDVLGHRTTKTNFKAVLESYKPTSNSIGDLSDIYVERPSIDQGLSIEQVSEQEILKPGALLRIQGSLKMGKTKLLSRLINFAKSQNFNVIPLSLGLAQKEDYESLDSFLKWLCINANAINTHTSKQPKNNIKNCEWENFSGNSKIKAMNYIEDCLLKNDEPNEPNKPLVLALDDLDLVYHYGDDKSITKHTEMDDKSIAKHTEIIEEFLTWLRALHERGNSYKIWRNFRLILTYREIYTHLPAIYSPFNVGRIFELTEFNEKQIHELVNKHGLRDELSEEGIKLLMKKLSGHPCLTQEVLTEIKIKNLPLEKFLEKANSNRYFYSKVLEKQLFYLKKNEDMKKVFEKVIQAESPIKDLDEQKTTQLKALGLIKLKDNGFVPFCELYRECFKEVL